MRKILITLRISEKEHLEVKEHCIENDIDYISTFFRKAMKQLLKQKREAKDDLSSNK